MQPVSDAQFLDVAQPCVELAQRLAARRLRREAAFGGEPGGEGAIDDRIGDEFRAPGIEAAGGRIFVQQRFDLAGGAGEFGFDQRRGHMADRHGADAAARLRRLAGIVDDERIDDRRCARQDRRRAIRGEGDRLAGQPFERAVRAEVDHGVDTRLLAQQEIEGDIGMAGRQGRVVIFVASPVATTAVRLDREREIAGRQRGEMKCAISRERIVLRVAHVSTTD